MSAGCGAVRIGLRPPGRRTVEEPDHRHRRLLGTRGILLKLSTDWIGDHGKDNRHSARGLLERPDRGDASSQDYVGPEPNQLCRVFANFFGATCARGTRSEYWAHQSNPPRATRAERWRCGPDTERWQPRTA